MPTPTKGPRLGGSPAHERLMLANLATALFEHGRITTTHTKAKRLRPLAEKLITFAKRGDIHSRRRVLTVVRRKDVTHQLFTDIGPRFAQRPGGYTRIVKLEPRQGDNAPMAVIELVSEQPDSSANQGSAAARARRVRQSKTQEQPVAALAEDRQADAAGERDTPSADSSVTQDQKAVPESAEEQKADRGEPGTASDAEKDEKQ